jgi:uncharacterized protein
MTKLKKWLIILIVLFHILIAGYLAVTFRFLDFFVDLWWFDSLGYKGFFLQRLLYRYAVFTGVAVFFFFIFLINFKLAPRLFSNKREEKNEKQSGRLMRLIKAGSGKLYIPLSLILALVIAVPFYEEWEKALLFFFGQNTGVSDPLFGNDIGYYLFSYPIYTLIQSKILTAFLLVFLITSLLYFFESRFTGAKNNKLSAGATIHTVVLFAITSALLIWGFILDRHTLLYTKSNEPLFFGPGYTEMWVTLPSIWMASIFMGLASLAIIIYMTRKKGLKTAIIFIAAAAASIWSIHSSYLSELTDKYYVKPNEMIKEKPYMEANINATLNAYGIDQVETLQYSASAQGYNLTGTDVMETLRNIPVWDRNLLDDVYKQLQGIHPYYEFPSVDVDRYKVSGRYQQVYLGARELDTTNLPDYAGSWPNRHLQYTHGYGVVMTPASQDGDEVMTWFIRDMPVSSNFGFELEQPGIYYGLGHYEYAIAPNDSGEVDHLDNENSVMSDYAGKGGIPISSYLKKLLLWTHFKERNIFFTTKTNELSKLLLRRNIIDRIKTITPFFLLDSDPYLVVTKKGLFWIQDAFTVSDCYPNVRSHDDEYNYIRNPVKIIIDAYNGSVDYYVTTPDEPIVRAYTRIYPGLLKPISEMPKALRAHLRYPKDLFKVQLAMYGEYHQTDPETFYRRADSWEIPKLLQGDQMFSSKPYYLTLNILNKQTEEFLLLCPLSPSGRSNLRALAVAGCDGDNYGKLFMYSFPKGKQVYGPSQINTLIDQDTDIAQQLTLWDQAGSEVIRGRMIILPVGNFMLYIQPVYLSSATSLKILELKRLIVSQGEIAVMDASLEKALERLEGRLNSRLDTQEKRFPLNNVKDDKAEEEARENEEADKNEDSKEVTDENHSDPDTQEESSPKIM